MTYLFFGLKAASLLIALRFYRNIKLIKHEPKYYFYQIRQLKLTFLILCGLTLFGSLGYHFLPYQEIKSYFVIAPDESEEMNLDESNLDKFYGEWQLRNSVTTVGYYTGRIFDYDEARGKWNVTDNKLYIKYAGRETEEYLINTIESDFYEIMNVNTKEIIRADRIK